MIPHSEMRTNTQAIADRFGLYFRIRADYFGEINVHGVPKPKNQYGADLDGELIQPTTYRPEDWS